MKEKDISIKKLENEISFYTSNKPRGKKMLIDFSVLFKGDGSSAIKVYDFLNSNIGDCQIKRDFERSKKNYDGEIQKSNFMKGHYSQVFTRPSYDSLYSNITLSVMLNYIAKIHNCYPIDNQIIDVRVGFTCEIKSYEYKCFNVYRFGGHNSIAHKSFSFYGRQFVTFSI